MFLLNPSTIPEFVSVPSARSKEDGVGWGVLNPLISKLVSVRGHKAQAPSPQFRNLWRERGTGRERMRREKERGKGKGREKGRGPPIYWQSHSQFEAWDTIFIFYTLAEIFNFNPKLVLSSISYKQFWSSNKRFLFLFPELAFLLRFRSV